MRIKKSVSKNSVSYSVIKDIIKNGRRTTKVVKALGNAEQIRAMYPDQDPEEWAKEQARRLSEEENDGKRRITTLYNKSVVIDPDVKIVNNVGYLFLEKICSRLGLDKIFAPLQKKYKIKYSLSEIMRMLINTRILYPSSKRNSYKQAFRFLEEPTFSEKDMYRSLKIFVDESDFIESQFYKNSLKLAKRNTKILYYDCTNFYFEIQKEEHIKKYGKSKENRPNPIVQMGLFMDGSGIPLAFTIFPGNENEQGSLRRIEEKIMQDFDLSQFIVCTDAGLSSAANRRFNDIGGRAFITTRSLKKLPKKEKEFLISPVGWKLSGSSKTYDLRKVNMNNNNNLYYKEMWSVKPQTEREKKSGQKQLEERLLVTFSPKTMHYQRSIRQRQVERAIRSMENSSRTDYSNPNSPKRFTKQVHSTDEGEVAENEVKYLDVERILEEEKYDGMYLVCTNLEGSAKQIIEIAQRRWEIEDCFRVMKSELLTRPFFVRLEDSIKAHFLSCFLSLTVIKIIQKGLGDYSIGEITEALRDMNWAEIQGEGYTPNYQRTNLTDKLHKHFGFRTDYSFFDRKMVRDLKRFTKSPKKGK